MDINPLLQSTSHTNKKQAWSHAVAILRVLLHHQVFLISAEEACNPGQFLHLYEWRPNTTGRFHIHFTNGLRIVWREQSSG